MFQNTSMRFITASIMFIHITGFIYGQEKRVVNFNSEEVPYYLSVNFKHGFSILPNLNAKIIIVQKQTNHYVFFFVNTYVPLFRVCNIKI